MPWMNVFRNGWSDFSWWHFKKGVRRGIVFFSNRLFGKNLTHRSRLASWLNQRRLAFAALASPTRRRQARFERENPDAPWLVPEAIAYIEQALCPDFVGFEWGCGRSTLWFARRVCHVTSVEGRRAWFEEVKRKVDAERLSDRVTLRLAEVTSEYNFLAEEIDRYARMIDSIPADSLDFILVDGHFREACLDRCGGKLRYGGLLIIDNTDVLPLEYRNQLKTSATHVWNNGISETTVIRNV